MSIKSIRHFFWILTSLVIMTGCGAPVNNSGMFDSLGTDPWGTNPVASVTIQAIQGDWTRDPYSVGGGMYIKDEMLVSGDQVELKADECSDQNCLNVFESYQIISTIMVENPQNGSGSTPVDYMNNQEIIIPQTVDEANLFNSQNYCGHASWVAGQAVNVTGTPCASSATVYSVMALQGTMLYVGQSSGAQNGTSPQTRYTIFQPTPFMQSSLASF